ncbi:hypothetical protein [Nonomuraea helvata]
MQTFWPALPGLLVAVRLPWVTQGADELLLKGQRRGGSRSR